MYRVDLIFLAETMNFGNKTLLTQSDVAIQFNIGGLIRRH